ncbi:MAG: class I SAM-dependent methyltransferase [bacterium]
MKQTPPTMDREYQGDFETMLTRMVSWLLLVRKSDRRFFECHWGGSPLDAKTIFSSARALQALCAAYPYVLEDRLYGENCKKSDVHSLRLIMKETVMWLIDLGVEDEEITDSLHWWSGDNEPLEIARSTCAVLNALMEYRERLSEERLPCFLQKDGITEIESTIAVLDDIINRGVNWIIGSITADDELITNATTGDKAILFRGGFSNIPDYLYRDLRRTLLEMQLPKDYSLTKDDESQRTGKIPRIIHLGRSFMGAEFDGLVGERGLTRLGFRFDAWATADCLQVLARQLVYNRLKSLEDGQRERSGKLPRNQIRIMDAVEKIAEALWISRNSIGIWNTEHACANFFILSFIYNAFEALPGFIDRETLIDRPRVYLAKLITSTVFAESKEPPSKQEVYRAASDLSDPCVVFGLARYQLLAEPGRHDLQSFSWFYKDMLKYDHIPKNIQDFRHYRHVPLPTPQIDKTSWAVMCISEILRNCGLNQRRLTDYKRWALAFHLTAASVDVFQMDTRFQVLFALRESQYPLFRFTHRINSTYLKEVLISKSSVRWLDIGCGTGRNLEVIAELPDDLRAKLSVVKGLDPRDSGQHEQFQRLIRKWRPDNGEDSFVKSSLADFNEYDSYNFATATLVMHELPLEHMLSSLRNAINCLIKDGDLVIVDSIDYHSNEVKIITWELHETKDLLGLFKPAIKVRRDDTDVIPIRHSFMVEDFMYYTVVVRKLAAIPEISEEQHVAYRSLLEKKLANLKQRRIRVAKEMEEKVGILIPPNAFEQAKRRRELVGVIQEIDKQRDLIKEMTEKDILNCLECDQLSRQIKSISEYLQAFKK